MNGSKLFGAGLGLAMLLVAAPAAAQPIEVEAPPSMQVSFADLNIGSAAGRATLDGRIRAAANRLCRPFTTGALGERMERRACYSTAVGNAGRDLDQLVAARRSTGFAGRTTIVVAAR